MTKVTKPVILDETGKSIRDALDGSSAAILAAVTDGYNKDLTLQEVVDARENFQSLGQNVKQKPYYFNNVADMKAAKLKAGDCAITLGYYEANDGGYALYYIDNKTSYTYDNFNFIKLSNNLSAVIIDFNIYTDNITYEEHYDNISQTTYYITNVPLYNKYGEENKWQLGVGKDNTVSLDSLESTIDFAKRKNASICINAGLYQLSSGIKKPFGVFIQNGEILQDVLVNRSWYILGIKEDGSWLDFPTRTTNAQTVLDSGCVNAFVGFGFIIRNGQAIPDTSTEVNPLQILCRKTNGDYLIFTCDGRTKYDLGMTISDVQRILANYDIEEAFHLDGGGSTSTVIDLQKINKDIDNQYTDRANNNFLYIAKTSIKNTDLNNSFGLISKLRQDMIKRFIEIKDVWSGYLKLYSDGLYPGVEFYQENETEERTGKIWLNYNGFRIKKRSAKGEEEIDLLNVTDGYFNYLGNTFGEFYQHITTVSDLNSIFRSGLYFANSNTLNTPKSGNYLVIQTRTNSDTSNNKQQYAIAFSGSNSYIYTRRATDGSSGSYGNWEEVGFCSGNTSGRPNAKKNGCMYFDTTLNKPIWYNNGNWYDATGTVV